MIDRKKRAHEEAVRVCTRLRAQGDAVVSRRFIYAGSTDTVPKRLQRVKAHAIHLLEAAGVLSRSNFPRPGCRCGGCREKRFVVDFERLETFR